MLLQIPNVLSPEQVAYARERLHAAEWVDGRVTAGHQSAQVKRNLQLPEGSPVPRPCAPMSRRLCSSAIRTTMTAASC